MIINGRKFNTSKESKKILVFSRKYFNNIRDIAGCAQLAMNKAVIGICALDSLEIANKELDMDFFIQKAVQVYYVLYHLFTCCMLLDATYPIEFGVYEKDGKYYTRDDHSIPFTFGTTFDELTINNPSKPNYWKERGKLEQDLAVRIKHNDIKEYCKQLREKKRRSSFIKVLFDHFVKEDPITILYEKAVYIRDRSVYRPTLVNDLGGSFIQTSKNVRKQIQELPNAKELYSAVLQIHQAICYSRKKKNYAIDPIGQYNTSFASYSYFGIEYDEQYAKELGYVWEDLEKMGAYKFDHNKGIPSFLCQFMELFRTEHALLYFDKYFLQLHKIALKNNNCFHEDFEKKNQ